MGTEHSMGTCTMTHAGAMPAIVELMTEMWGLLTEEQKKKVMVMRMRYINNGWKQK